MPGLVASIFSCASKYTCISLPASMSQFHKKVIIFSQNENASKFHPRVTVYSQLTDSTQRYFFSFFFVLTRTNLDGTEIPVVTCPCEHQNIVYTMRRVASNDQNVIKLFVHFLAQGVLKNNVYEVEGHCQPRIPKM